MCRAAGAKEPRYRTFGCWPYRLLLPVCHASQRYAAPLKLSNAFLQLPFSAARPALRVDANIAS